MLRVQGPDGVVREQVVEGDGTVRLRVALPGGRSRVTLCCPGGEAPLRLSRGRLDAGEQAAHDPGQHNSR
jgi:hypothetical protein